MAVLKQAAVLVGLVSGVVGLVFLLLPQLKPESPPPPEPPPAEQSAKLSGLQLGADVTKGQYLERTDQPKLGFTAEQLARRGAFVTFRVVVVGFKGREIPLQREVFDARTGDQVDELRAVVVTPTANRVDSPWHDWVALRPGEGSYVLVVKVLDERGVRPMACAQSEPFGGLDGLVPGRPLVLCEGT
jgi:hypothetical protein